MIVWPQKVNLTFNTVPAGLTVYLDGIAKTTPFVYDTLLGFQHTLEIRDQSVGATSYTFDSWSDGGAQTHTITVPATDRTYTGDAQDARPSPHRRRSCRRRQRVNSGTTNSVAFNNNNTAGNLIVAYVIWSNSGNVSLTGQPREHVHARPGVPTLGHGSAPRSSTQRTSPAAPTRSPRPSPARSAAAGRCVYVHEYSGVDKTNPLDVETRGSGTDAKR